jgi:hypothetical protein
MDGHRTSELRSLAYHRAIAERMRTDPNVLTAARERVRHWQAGRDVNPRYIVTWHELLANSPSEAANLIEQDTEEMVALRQVSAFAGVLDPRTRWMIWRSTTTDNAAQRK